MKLNKWLRVALLTIKQPDFRRFEAKKEISAPTERKQCS
jgi:hypothetical protein